MRVFMSMSGRPLAIGLCAPEDRRHALGVLYRRVPRSMRGELIDEVLFEAASGLVDLSGLWVARRRRQIVGALLTQALAGRLAAVWAPEVSRGWRRGHTAVSLLHTALDDLARRGFRLAQALVDESAPPCCTSDLTAGGMPHVTDLIYLDAATELPVALPPGLPALEWSPFGPTTEADFRATLEATYTDSLDMPELEGLRSLDDTLAGHRAAGRFNPDRWLVGHVRHQPDCAAILLLSETPDRDAWEVAYLGLTPSARGRGLGRAAMALALEMARPHVPRIQLAVDARNLPAYYLYRHVGMSPFDQRSVHLAILPRITD
jgi:ribosomal protein S18 acetylase RimI-like enzyme